MLPLPAASNPFGIGGNEIRKDVEFNWSEAGGVSKIEGTAFCFSPRSSFMLCQLFSPRKSTVLICLKHNEKEIQYGFQ